MALGPAVPATDVSQPLSAPPRPRVTPPHPVAGQHGLPGLAGGVSGGLPGLGGNITNPAVAEGIVASEMYQLVVSMQQSALLAGSIQRSFQTMLDAQKESVAKTHKAALDTTRKVAEIAGGIAGGVNPRQVQAAANTAGGFSGDTSNLRRPAGAAASPPEGLAEGQDGPMSFSQGRGIGSDMKSLRQYGARSLNKYMSERTFGPTYSGGPGAWKDEAGNPVSDEVGQRFATRMNRIGRVTGAINAYGEGKGLSGALAAGSETVAKFAGPIGVAVGLGATALGQASSQRAANSFYQQIYGGSNFSGFAQRAQEGLFSRIQMAGLMDSGQASQLFRGVSSLGLQGGQRQDALDFATRNFSKTGMDISTALDLISQSVATGVNDFKNLNTQLDAVSKTAKEAGVNVGEAQKAFAATNATVQQSVTSGPGSANIAAGIQNKITSVTARSGVSGVGVTGLLGSQSLMMQATNLGMNISQYEGQIQTNPNLLGRGMNTIIQQVVNATLSPQVITRIQQMKQQIAPGNAPIAASDAQQIGRQLESEGLIFPQAVAQIATQLGLSGITIANASQAVVLMALGAFDFSKMGGASGPGATRGVAGGGSATTVAGQAIKTGSAFTSAVAGRSGVSQSAQLLSALGYTYTPPATQGGKGAGEGPVNAATRTGMDSKTSAAAQAYVSQVAQTGKRDPVIESLLSKSAGLGDSTFRVQTSKGARNVSLATAISDYADQLRTGDVSIASGTGQGKLVSDITKVSSTTAANSASQDPKGTSKERSGQTNNAHITVSPTAALSRLLKFNVDTDTANRTGTPAPAFPAPPTLPSATGGD